MADSGSFNADLGINMQFNIDGAGLTEMTKTIKEISKGKDLQRYWKDVESATNNAVAAIKEYKRDINSQDLATDFLKQINALKAITKKENLSEIFPDMKIDFNQLVESAKKVAPLINSEFSSSKFEQAFNTFDLLKEKGIELEEVFKQLSSYSKIVQENLNLDRENRTFRNLIGDKDIEKIKKDLSEIQHLRKEAEKTFTNFLKVNNIEKTDYWGNERFSDYFSEIRNGTMTATKAITQFKTEYAYLLEENFKANNNTFGLEQLQAFSTTLDSIFRQVEETSLKINDIISNGVIAKSVQNLSTDTTLSDSQRSLFGNLLQDEESLKSITALFQKLIEESNQTKNTEIFNSEQFVKIEELFTNIESHLSSIKSVLVDVGDGEELSPLLKQLDNIREATSNIKLSLNLDFGNEISEKLNQKISQVTTRQLEAYRKLFSAIKGTGKTNKEMLNFYEPENASTTELIGMYQSVIKRARNHFKVGDNDIYEKLLGSTYKDLNREIDNASRQLSNAENKRPDSGILRDLFGNSKDLSGIVEQLNIIVSKLDEISISATKFSEVFKDGLNITTSVEEITTLTNKVKELETELERVKSVSATITTSSTSTQKTNISSDFNPAIEQQNKLQEELKETQQQAENTAKAILKVTGYRGTNGGDPVTSNKSGATFWDSKKNVANMYGTNSSDKTLWSSELSFNNPFTFDAKKQKYGDITYLGDGADYASREIIELTQRENELRKALDSSTKSGLEEVKMAYELQDVCQRIAKISKDTSNPYGTHSTDWFAEYAKNNGYDGVAIKNVLDTPDSYAKNGTEVSDVYITFQREQLQNTTLLAKANHELAESEREVALAELGVTQNQKKDAFQGADATASVEKTTQAIREENNALEETANKAKQAVSELVKSRDVVSQNWYREKGTVIGKDSKGNDITRDADEFSFVERLKNGQLQTVLATYNEETGKWAEQIINVRTAFEQVEKAIISADNKIASLEMTKEKTLAAHPGYDTTADDNQIAIERKKRDELQNTLNLYGQEKEYVFEIEAANKRIADNQERLNNKKQSQTNLRQAVSDEQFLKELNEAWNSAIKVNNALNETNSLLNSLKVPNGFEGSFSTLESEIKRLNSEFGSGKISATEYANSIKKAFSNYQTPIDNRSKDIWNELTTSLDRYATLQKRIASNNALSTDNEEATKLLEHIHELQRNDILPTEKLTASNEKLQQINQTVADLKAKLKESTLDSLQGSIDKYQRAYNNYSVRPANEQSDAYKSALINLNSAIQELEKYKATLSGMSEVTEKQEAHIEKLVSECAKASDAFKQMSASQKGAKEIGIAKSIQRINKDLAENTRYSKTAKQNLQALLNQLESGDPSINLEKINSEIIKIENSEIRAGRAGKSFLDIFKTKAVHGFLGQAQSYLSMYIGFYGMVNKVRSTITTVKELDTALVDLKKTTTMTEQQLNKFYYSSNDVARQMGVTTKEIIEQASAWSRLGYSSNEAATEMAKLSSQFASISPGMEVDESQSGLVSIMKAWSIDPDDVKSQIMDPINKLGNTMAESNLDIVEGMERSAAALAAVGTSVKDGLAMFSGIQEVLQNAEKSGTALRSVALRIRSFDESTEEYSDDLANITGELIDLTKTAEHAEGVSIFKPGSTTEFKDLTDYFGEIADIWDEMSQKQQNDFLIKAFGKNQAQAGAALIQNYKGVAKALDEIDNSAGSSDQEMQTIESKQNCSYVQKCAYKNIFNCR